MNTDQHDIQLQPLTIRLFRVLIIAGVVLFAASLLLSPQRAWGNLLLVSIGLLGLGLGAAFFMALQYVCSAGWAAALKRVPEAMSMTLPLGLAGLILVLLFRPSLYPWVNPDASLEPLLHGFKGFWLNRPFFLGRAASYMILWVVLAGAIVKTSRRQDQDGADRHTHRNVRLSALFIVIFAVTCTLASFDWIMSLEPEWYSTIFGVYNFAGIFVSALAVMVLAMVWLQKVGPFRDILTEEHLHDLGKLILAFSTFWAYIWFSQYMLIWYANFPEETGYFVHRQQGAWYSLFLLNFFVNWVIPFFVLLSAKAKRSKGVMVKVAVLLLAGRWLDLYLEIMPSVAGESPAFGLAEIGLLAVAVGAFPLLLVRVMRQAPLVPRKDPYFLESLHHKQ